MGERTVEFVGEGERERRVMPERAFDRGGEEVASGVRGVAGDGLQLAEREGWLARFDMFDWVGGRTSITSAVGLLPAALIGADLRAFLAGAAAAAIISAPGAGATDSADCSDRGTSSVCTRTGHSSINDMRRMRSSSPG